MLDKPILFEVFTTSENESDSLKAIRQSITNSTGQARKVLKNVVGDKGLSFVKKILK